GPLVWNLIRSLFNWTVWLLSAVATSSVVTLPEPGDPRATAATVPTIPAPTAAMTRRRPFLFILGMSRSTHVSFAFITPPLAVGLGREESRPVCSRQVRRGTRAPVPRRV